MAVAIQVIAAVLALAGLAGFFYGTDLLPTERGIAYTISSVIALSGAAVTGALALVVRRLDILSAQLKSGAVAPDPAPAKVEPVTDQGELPLVPPVAIEPPRPQLAADAPPAPIEEPAAPLPAPEPMVRPVLAPLAPEPPPAPEPVIAAEPVAEPPAKTGRRFKLPSFKRGAKTAAATAAATVAATAALAASETSRSEDPQPTPAEGSGSADAGSGTMGAPEPVVESLEEVVAPALEPEPLIAETARPRVEFAVPKLPPAVEEPPAPPRLPVAEDALPARRRPEPLAAPADRPDPMEALEAELDRLIPLKPRTPPAPPPRAPEPEPEPDDFRLPDVDRPDEALEMALSDEPVRPDGTRPEPPPPGTPVYDDEPEPQQIPLRGGLAGPIELDEPVVTPPPGAEVIGSYESGGARYTMYSNGSVIVDIDGKTLQFGSLEQLREFIENGSAKG